MKRSPRSGSETPHQAARGAYEAFAPYYDSFTRNHDFELWIGNLIPALERQGLPPQGRLLDVACGTGKSFLPMLERGWAVTACDISPAMIEVARRKTKGTPSVDLEVADMRELPRFGEFALVWCLTDAANYLLTHPELEAALAGMGRNLGPEGVLAFDLNTLHSFQTFFAEDFVVEADGLKMSWSGLSTPDVAPGSICEASFRVESTADAALLLDPSIHRERHFSEGEVFAALDRAGLQCVAVFGIHYDAILQQPLDEKRHTKAVYFAKRAA